jgi:hypothetical protein
MSAAGCDAPEPEQLLRQAKPGKRTLFTIALPEAG